MKKRILFCACLIIFCSMAIGQEWFVSPTGDDFNSGTADKPFKTLVRARDAARKGRIAGSPVTIYCKGGIYSFTESLVFDSKDSGSPSAPYTIKNYNDEKVFFKGSQSVKPSDFKKITSKEVLIRIPKHLRDSIKVLDLHALGMKNIYSYPDLFIDDGNIIELFMDNKRMPLSRYPNGEEVMTMKKVIINGGGQETKNADWATYYGEKTKHDKPPRSGVFEYRDDRTSLWANSVKKGVWVKGFWRIPWQNEAVRVSEIDTVTKQIKLAAPVPGGIGNKYTRPDGNGKEPYWVMNLLEEVDMPGEWAVDFSEGLLYFYPPKKISTKNTFIADIGKSLLVLDKTHHVNIEGITIEENLGNGIEIKDGINNNILGCTIRNVTKNGIVFNDGYCHSAMSNDIYETGEGGIWLKGGDEKSIPRISSKFLVENNHVYNFSRLTRVYAAGINAGFTGGGGGGHHPCVGATIKNNRVHGTPHVGILYGSYDNKFEFNEVYGYCQFSDDMGAFYCYDKYERMGYDTICYNFIHNSPIGDAIYFDNDHPEMQVYGNIVVLQSAPKRRGTAFLYKIGSQSKNPQSISCFNNIAINCNYGFQFVSAKIVNNINNNVAVNCSQSFSNKIVRDKAYDTTDVFSNGKNWIYNKDPGFENMEGNDFRLKPSNQIEKDLPGFEPIAFNKIGLYVDKYRKVLPSDIESQRWENKPSLKESKGTEILDRK